MYVICDCDIVMGIGADKKDGKGKADVFARSTVRLALATNSLNPCQFSP